MKQNLLVAIIGLLLSTQVMAKPFPSREARAAFRESVEEYQVFVVPRCAPDEVQAYVNARANRDNAFVRSLRSTKLYADYKKAVVDRAKKDSDTVFHCFGPPPPPPPPGTAPIQSDPVRKQPQPNSTLTEHFAAGDRQFEIMVRLRNAALASSGK